MMLYPAMNKLKSHIPNRYMLVNVVALLARIHIKIVILKNHILIFI